MRHLARYLALSVAMALPAHAETFTWDCNTEPDMKEYRGERSADAGASWGVLFTKAHEPGCSQLSYQSTAYVKPGDKLARLFAIDKSGNVSNPSAPPYPYKVAAPIIGNPGGQTETPLPPSPFAGAVTPPPPIVTPPPPVVTPPPPVVVPPPPVVVKPGDVGGFAAGSITQDSAIISGTVPDGAKINLRYMKAPLSWGAATIIANYPGESYTFTHDGLNMDHSVSTGGIAYIIFSCDSVVNCNFRGSGGANQSGFRLNNAAHHVRFYKDGTDNQDQYDSADYVGHEAYALTLLQRASDPAYWYPGDAYTDWVSLTWYFLDYYDSGWSWLSGSDILIPNADWITSLNRMMTQVAGVTSKPVLLAEFGMPDGMDSNTAYGATKVTDGFNAVLDTYPQIKAVSLWTNSTAWFVVDNFPYDCLIRPGTTQATALQAVIAAHPGQFVTCIRTTGNVMQPNCTP